MRSNLSTIYPIRPKRVIGHSPFASYSEIPNPDYLVHHSHAVIFSAMNENTTISELQNTSDRDGYVKRKQMYVKRQFQSSMLLQSTLVTFIIVNVIIMTIFWAIDAFSDPLQFKTYLAFTIAAIEALAFAILYKLNLVASHRIAGPIFSMERRLSEVEQGDLMSTLKLRKNDQFPETAEQLNSTLNFLRKKVNNSQYLAAQIQQHPERAEQLAQQLAEELEFFNTTDTRDS